MAKHNANKCGRGIEISSAFIHKPGVALHSRERPPAPTPKRVVTTWECLNCGNSIRSTRGMSRCPRCGSIEMFRVDAMQPQHQIAERLHPGAYAHIDDGDDIV